MMAAIPWTHRHETAIGEGSLVGRPDTDNRDVEKPFRRPRRRARSTDSWTSSRGLTPMLRLRGGGQAA